MRIARAGNEQLIAANSCLGGCPHELVALQCGSDLVCGYLFASALHTLRTQHFSDAAQVHRLRAILIQSDDVLDRTAEIWLAFGSKQYPSRAYILGKSDCGNSVRSDR